MSVSRRPGTAGCTVGVPPRGSNYSSDKCVERVPGQHLWPSAVKNRVASLPLCSPAFRNSVVTGSQDFASQPWSQCSGIAALTYNASWHLGIGSQCGGITACNYNALWHCGNSLLMPAWHICSRASRTRHENLAYEERRNTSLILLKGQCREIFEPFLPLKDSTWAPIWTGKNGIAKFFVCAKIFAKHIWRFHTDFKGTIRWKRYLSVLTHTIAII